eukprot:GHVT01031568.1.p1 GENE.GHVT01031568.1~~GHVT01031568.1.p1  ORF type:complete len:401 (-),score=141.47 GHVT01031568.1:1083-2285(-)
MFYGLKLKPGQVTKADNSRGELFHVSSVTLHQPTDSAPVYIQIHDGRDYFTAAVLTKGSNETTTTDLFCEAATVKFRSTGGKNEVHVCGYFEPEEDPCCAEMSDEEEADGLELPTRKSAAGAAAATSSTKKNEKVKKNPNPKQMAEIEDEDDDEDDDDEVKDEVDEDDEDDDDEDDDDEDDDAHEEELQEMMKRIPDPQQRARFSKAIQDAKKQEDDEEGDDDDEELHEQSDTDSDGSDNIDGAYRDEAEEEEDEEDDEEDDDEEEDEDEKDEDEKDEDEETNAEDLDEETTAPKTPQGNRKRALPSSLAPQAEGKGKPKQDKQNAKKLRTAAAPSSSAGASAGTESYKKTIAEYLKKHGRTQISMLGQKVQKPADINVKLGVFLKSQPMFKINNGFVSL